MCLKIEIYQKNSEDKQEPTQRDFDEIINLLKERDFKTRKVPLEGSYKEPNLDHSYHCHATARKFAEINDKWEQVSGYLVEKVNFDNLSHSIRLTAHSVILNDKDDFFELMQGVYPLEKYYFICHQSGLQGYDLKAIR